MIIQGRKTSLQTDGEQAAGNIIFKVLRRSGHLELLNKLKTKLFDKLNSIDEIEMLSATDMKELSESI